jgi:hydroxymethylpyrimidine/phosphomethylpyrimidine kinase
MKTVLTIAGSDPSGGAGVQADIMTFSDFRVRGFSAITALTAQNGSSFKGVMPVPRSFFIKQVETLLSSFSLDAVKIGMLARAEIVVAVTGLIKKWKFRNIVLDPVLSSSSGYTLLGKRGIKALKKLLPHVTVLTPNLEEASTLSGISVKDVKGMEEAAVIIAASGPQYVLVKGGHLKGNPVDILYDGMRFHHYKGRRIRGKDLHGTGCVFSSAIAAGLARGRTVERAVGDAKNYLSRVIRARP